MKENRIKYLLKNTSIFGISNMATKLITFFLIPLYTYCLTTEEYGVVDLLFTISTVLVPILTLNISEAIYRFSMDKDADNTKIVSISSIICLFSIISCFLIIPILSLFQQYSNYSVYFCFYTISLILSQTLLVNIKGQEKLKLFSIGNILNTLLIAILNVIFLRFLDMKIEGYFLAYIIANIVTAIYAFGAGGVLKNLKSFNFDKKLFKEMSKYSIVLIPTSFMWWIMNSSDRIMITNMISSSANGIYAVSYKIPSILTTFAGIFNQAWMFSAISENESSDKEEFTNKIFYSMYIIMFFIAILIITFLKPFFKLYVSAEYFVAWKYVPILVLGSVFVTLGTFISTSYNVAKDSKGFLFSGLFGAIANIILNFILIPRFDVYGAAIATCISYILVFAYRLVDTRKYVKINFNLKMIIPIIILIINAVLLYIDSFIAQLLQIFILISTICIYRKYCILIVNKVLKRVKN